MPTQNPLDTYCVTTAADEVARRAQSRRLKNSEARAVRDKYAERIHWLMPPDGGDMPGFPACQHGWQLAAAYLSGGEAAVEAAYQSIVDRYAYERDPDANDDIWGDATDNGA